MKYRTVDRAFFGRSMVVWWKVPVLWRWISWARVPTIYLRPNADEFVLVEEEYHVRQIYEVGALHWIIGHLFDAEFRLKYEIPAKAARIRAMVRTGGYEPPGLIKYHAALMPSAYRLGSRWSVDEIESMLWRAYNLTYELTIRE